jgi:hypothetical protein
MGRGEARDKSPETRKQPIVGQSAFLVSFLWFLDSAIQAVRSFSLLLDLSAALNPATTRIQR